MHSFLEKIQPGRYLNCRLVLALDSFISFFGTLVSLNLAELIFGVVIVPDFRLSLMLAVSIVSSAAAFSLLKTHRSIIRHATLREMWKLAIALALKGLCIAGAAFWFYGGEVHTRIIVAITLIDVVLSVFLAVSVRVVMILVYEAIIHRGSRGNRLGRILIYGTSGKSVSMLFRLDGSAEYRVIAFLEPGSRKDYSIAGTDVISFTDKRDMAAVRDSYGIDAILFSSEADARKEENRLIGICTELGIKVLLAPGIDDVSAGGYRRNMVRHIRIEDLLGRPEIRISMDEITKEFHGKTVLVTGAAGSIGSELCRQLAGVGAVKRLVLFDNAETPMHNLRLELSETFPGLEVVPVIGDVRNPARVDMVFRTQRPQVVFHAAALKHVPLMEENPCEAVLVNLSGTRMVADKCVGYDVEKMVMVSTDKAVNPTGIMGCTKRLAEIYVQSLGLAIESGQKQGHTRFVTTRFGNVLGSNGSVIPRFREQIAKGGPVTVTHPDINRFFMTIPEACRLVMEAAAMTTGNQIFVFDMGEAVKITDLAKRMIELAGLKPDEDIKIEFTGLRPGEKLYEEVLANAENTLPTSHDRIRIAKVRDYGYEAACAAADSLTKLAADADIPEMVRLMKKIVPEFKSVNPEYAKYDN